MSETNRSRRKLTATAQAVARVRVLRESGRQQPIIAVGEITAGGNQVVTTQALPRRDPHRPRNDGGTDVIGGMSKSGELEPTVLTAIGDAVGKLFGGAFKVKANRVRKAVEKLNEQVLVANRNADTGHAPTPQRMAAADNENGVRRPKAGTTQPHKMRSTLDVFGVHFTDAEREVFRRFCADAEAATRTNIISKMYENMPRGGGGQGSDMSEAQHRAHTRFYFVLKRLGAQFQTIATAAVLEMRCETLGRAFTMEELGQQVTSYTDKALCRAAALGLVKATLWRLAECYLQWNALDAPAKKVCEDAQAEIDANKHKERLGRVATRSAPPVPSVIEV